MGTHVVTIPAGNTIPFKVSIAGDPVVDIDKFIIPLSLNKSVDIVLIDGEITGLYRLQGEEWQSTRWNYPFRINELRLVFDNRDGLFALMGMKVLLGQDSND